MRGKQAPKRKIQLEERYQSEVASKLINYVMIGGKKALAKRIVYGAMEQLEQETKTPAVDALTKAIENIKPKVEIRARRVGGANYQVPTPVSTSRQLSLALRWLMAAARSHRGKLNADQVLARELIAAFKGEGDAVRKKDDVHRMAEANRAFAQYAF